MPWPRLADKQPCLHRKDCADCAICDAYFARGSAQWEPRSRNMHAEPCLHKTARASRPVLRDGRAMNQTTSRHEIVNSRRVIHSMCMRWERMKTANTDRSRAKCVRAPKVKQTAVKAHLRPSTHTHTHEYKHTTCMHVSTRMRPHGCARCTARARGSPHVLPLEFEEWQTPTIECMAARSLAAAMRSAWSTLSACERVACLCVGVGKCARRQARALPAHRTGSECRGHCPRVGRRDGGQTLSMQSLRRRN